MSEIFFKSICELKKLVAFNLCLVMKASASDQRVGLGAEGFVLLAEIHNDGDVKRQF